MRPIVLAAFLLILTSCGNGDAPDASPDTTNDAAADMAKDSVRDTATDAEEDALAEDTQPDVPADTTGDAMPDAAPAGTATFVCVGNFGYRQATTNGSDWQTIPPSSSGDPHTPDLLRDVHFANGVFLAVGGDRNAMVMRSSDGQTWDEDLYQDGTQWKGGVTYGNGRWVAVGGVGTNIYSDDNGNTWTENSMRLPGVGRDIVFAAGRFVAVGDNGMIASSPDGLTWTSHMQSHGLTHSSIGYGHGLFVVLGNEWNGAGFDTVCLTSTDGENYTPCGFSADRFGDVSFVNGTLIVSLDSDGYAYTDDGLTWTEVGGEFPRSIRFGDGVFVGHRNGNRFFGDALDNLTRMDQGNACRDFEMGFVP